MPSRHDALALSPSITRRLRVQQARAGGRSAEDVGPSSSVQRGLGVPRLCMVRRRGPRLWTTSLGQSIMGLPHCERTQARLGDPPAECTIFMNQASSTTIIEWVRVIELYFGIPVFEILSGVLHRFSF
uniref:Uncharacterized protein n=1 Tax=Myotis myotis TaxID=51298 RepID=A0A7J7XHD1_MYOMY|nr:hypothetical protein mMyoMyo1_011667 [Myotis myotis]